MSWRNGVEEPTTAMTALVLEYTTMDGWYIAGELYRWDRQKKVWVGEATADCLQPNPSFRWLPEMEANRLLGVS